MAAAPAASSSSSSSNPPVGSAAYNQQANSDLASEYGYALSFLNSNPEIKKIFQKASTMVPPMPAAEFQAEIQNTKWFQQNSQALRQAQDLQKSDPATYAQNVSIARATISETAGTMGAQLSTKVLAQMASDAVNFGWTPNQVQQQLSQYVTTMGSTGNYAGQAGTNQQALEKMALDYGQTLSDSSLKKWVQNIAAGTATTEDYQAQMKQSATALYPQYAKQIAAGLTVNDIAQPYIQQMAQTLEKDPTTITVNDKNIQAALNGNANGTTGAAGETGQGMNMYQFQNMLRQDPQWATTKNAQDAASTATRSILQSFGFNW